MGAELGRRARESAHGKVSEINLFLVKRNLLKCECFRKIADLSPSNSTLDAGTYGQQSDSGLQESDRKYIRHAIFPLFRLLTHKAKAYRKSPYPTLPLTNNRHGLRNETHDVLVCVFAVPHTPKACEDFMSPLWFLSSG